jgi:hypothetical protein
MLPAGSSTFEEPDVMGDVGGTRETRTASALRDQSAEGPSNDAGGRIRISG